MEKKSPLKAPPLRTPGQSLQDEINDLIDDKLMPFYAVSVMLAIMAAYEWYAAIMEVPRQPILLTITALIMIALTTVRFVRGRRKVELLKQARDGEKAVGQFLEDLRRKGFYIFHDLIGDGFNLDHVIVGPKGVFTIETKTISKPQRGNSVVRYDGEQLTINGYAPDRNPIVQAKAQANWVKELLAEGNISAPIKPVVVYPGWYIENNNNIAKAPVWVLNPKALPTFIGSQPDRLNDSEIGLIKKMLILHIRKG